MDFYKHFYKVIAKCPDLNPYMIYSSICEAIAESPFATKQDLIDLTNAYQEYKERVENERITSAI
ncbi:hypothetical protein GCM10011409_43290 [Lentibacillus populi]|uniref:Uncharacterized protein n=1 Tax=Lentibacillus populi TaxID=1827502 RepID=A0A9W5U2T4_9BACI|nr:hypothetical protein [Lentibacillus populi]GGB61374.1 hypothetical protein GCM10011409_43290 [Lentibacillus populi]